MIDLYAELRSVVQALDRARVAHALVGGLAVSIYTTPRATEDIDILVARDDLERGVAVLTELGFRRAGQPMPVAGGRLEIQRLIRTDGVDVLPVDLLVAVDSALTGLTDDRRVVEWEGGQLGIIGVGSLRVLKRLRGSAQDRADLEALGPEHS
jgi:hypothetical protein